MVTEEERQQTAVGEQESRDAACHGSPAAFVCRALRQLSVTREPLEPPLLTPSSPTAARCGLQGASETT